jgi:hypothetical protein
MTATKFSLFFFPFAAIFDKIFTNSIHFFPLLIKQDFGPLFKKW